MEVEAIVQAGGVGTTLAALGVISYLVKIVTNHLTHADTVMGEHMKKISENTLKTLTIVERMNGKNGK